MALAKLAADANWRTTYTNNVETTPVAFGMGTISFKLVDETDANLSNSTTQNVRVYGIGRVGKACKVLSVQLTGSDALTCLNSALAVAGSITLDKATLNAPGQTISTNGNFSGGDDSSAVNANLLATGTITPDGCTINGNQSAAAPAKTFPDSTAFDYYIANGTSIPYGLLSSGVLNKKLISPVSSGVASVAANPNGIYVIDCGGSDLVIKQCRIVGTLVILNPGPNSRIGGASGNEGLCWSPAVANFPCLLVKGNIRISFNGAANDTLSESAVNINFNPNGTPYPYNGGSSDSDLTEVYPATIDGLIYVSGNLTKSSGNTAYPVTGNLVVGGTCSEKGDVLTTNFRAIYKVLPPPGFTGGGMLKTVPASWRWEAAP
ncbi:MAG: hypothetical protein QM770_05935 [Tepidisphaeraceae bacterium]